VRSRAEPLSDDVFLQGESPRVDARTGELYWIDMRAGRLHVGDFRGGALVTTRSIDVGESVGAAAALSRDGAGWAIAAGRDILHVSDDGRVTPWIESVAPAGGFSLNDGICSPDGAFWIGSQTGPRRPEGALYRIGADLDVSEVLGGVTVSNGIAFDPPGTRLYYVDTLPHRRLETFLVTDAGLSARTTLAEFAGGNPDGIVLDDDGHVWVALWDAGEVRRIAPDGSVSAVVDVPVPRPTAVVLWEGMLVITTTAQEGVPLSGRLFAAPVTVGAPASPGFAAVPPAA
jgi:sugar lactone lactonase YvrE